MFCLPKTAWPSDLYKSPADSEIMVMTASIFDLLVENQPPSADSELTLGEPAERSNKPLDDEVLVF